METLKNIPIKEISVWDNSRIRIERSSLSGLMADIKQKGLLQPVKVWNNPTKKEYVLIFGNRRLEACKNLGWVTIPSIVVDNQDLDFQNFITQNLSENIYREDLSILEISRVCGLLMEQGRSISEISVITGIPLNRVKDSLRLIKKIPAKYRPLIKYQRTGNQQKKGNIPVSVVGEIFGNVRTSKKLKEKDIDKFMEAAQKYELTQSDILVIKRLMTSGMTFSQAFKERENYAIIQPKILVNKFEMAKYEITAAALFKGLVAGEIKPNKKLIASFDED